jgi:hypothetical protein
LRKDSPVGPRQLAAQPRSRKPPVTLQGRDRYPEYLSDIGVIHTSEEPELDDLCRSRIQFVKPGQGIVKIQHILLLPAAEAIHAGKRNLHSGASPFLRFSGASMVNQDASKLLR